MRATDHFGIKRGRGDDWFDTILDVDTKLFVDPFLIFKESSGVWADGHARLIAHFNQAFLLVAKGNRDPKSLPYRKALALLQFKEPRELCLGYTEEGTGGSGSSGKLARLIAAAIAEAIRRGLKDLKHTRNDLINAGRPCDNWGDGSSCPTIQAHRSRQGECHPW